MNPELADTPVVFRSDANMVQYWGRFSPKYAQWPTDAITEILVRCRRCVGLGLRSQIHIGETVVHRSTGSSFYDEEGRFHKHTHNQNRTPYKCTEGHDWTLYSRMHPDEVCKWGDWSPATETKDRDAN